MEVTIRRYRDDDESAAVSLWHMCGLVVPWNDPVIDIRRKMEFQPELFFVAEYEGVLVGTVMAGYEGHRGWINYLAVDPAHRRKAIGTILVRHATTELSKLGCQKVNLQVRETNSAVIAFYEALGFTRDDVISLGLRLHEGTAR